MKHFMIAKQRWNFVKAQKLPAGGGDLGAINEHSDDDIDIDDI